MDQARNWKEIYWDNLIVKNFEEAVPLKDAHFPKSFYKYRVLNERTIDALDQSYIWLSDIASLNDPFECSIQFDNDECLGLFYGTNEYLTFFYKVTGQALSKNEIGRLTKSEKPHEEMIKICKSRRIPYNVTSEQQLQKVQNRWNQIVEQTNRDIRVCSFSLIKSSLLLWSHYSDEHKGICVEYDFLDDNDIRPFLQPIIYRDKVHKIGLFENYTPIQMIASSLIKSKDWEYEQEWRLTIFRQSKNENEFPHKMKVPKPKAIYLGTRFSLNNGELKDRLYEISRMNNIRLFEMKKDPNDFKLID